jgi:polysaccharide biosynthesis transport protein
MMTRSQATSVRNGNASAALHSEPDSPADRRMSSPHPSQPPAALSPATEKERPPLERALASARRNWLLLLICVLVVPAVALAYSLLQTPKYTSSASILFTDDLSESDAEREAATILQLGSLEQIAARTANALPETGYSAGEISDKVEASPAGISDVIEISATDPEPEVAAEIANEFADQFIVFRRSANRAKILEARSFVEAQIDQLTPEEQESPAGEALEQRARDFTVRAAAETGNVQVVQPATVPDSPSSPKTNLNVALGLLLGLILGIGLSLLRDQLDRSLKEPEEVEEAFRLPILATIPQSQNLGERGVGAEPVGEEREAFRMLRANLQYFNLEQPIHSILVTSPSSQDGKTTVSWNLSVAEAKSGKKVLHLEADMRRPTLAAGLGQKVEEDAGLSLVLAGALSPQDAIRAHDDVDIIFAGPLPPNPAELLDSPRMIKLLEWAQKTYDRVVIDTPPAAVVADAIPLTTQVDSVIVVVRLGHSPREEAEHLREQLSHIEATTMGVVVNGVAPRPDDSYYRTQGGSETFSRAYDRLSARRSSRSKERKREGV